MSSSAKMERRAETMVVWFESLPGFSTIKTDAEIAMCLHAISPHDGWVHGGTSGGNRHQSTTPNCNVALVRQIRRWVDRQTTGQFATYLFGIKRTGGGRNITHLRTKQNRLDSAQAGTVSQSQAGLMMERRHAEERGRLALKYGAEAEEWFQLGDFQRSSVCTLASNDYDQYGRLMPTTKAALERLGLL